MINPNKYHSTETFIKLTRYADDITHRPLQETDGLYRFIIYQKTPAGKVFPLYDIERCTDLFHYRELCFSIRVYDHEGKILQRRTTWNFSQIQEVDELIEKMIDSFQYGYVWVGRNTWRPFSNLPSRMLYYHDMQKLLRYSFRNHKQLLKPIKGFGQVLSDTSEIMKEYATMWYNPSSMFTSDHHDLIFPDFTLLATSKLWEAKKKYCYIASNDAVARRLDSVLLG